MFLISNAKCVTMLLQGDLMEKSMTLNLRVNLSFAVTLPKVPAEVNADAMSADQLRVELKAGYDDMLVGNVQDAGEAFARFRDAHR